MRKTFVETRWPTVINVIAAMRSVRGAADILSMTIVRAARRETGVCSVFLGAIG